MAAQPLTPSPLEVGVGALGPLWAKKDTGRLSRLASWLGRWSVRRLERWSVRRLGRWSVRCLRWFRCVFVVSSRERERERDVCRG